VALKKVAADVFARIDMKGGDREQCWPWTGGYTSKHIPSFQYSGRKRAAYAVAFECVHGPLLVGEVPRHICDAGPGRHYEHYGWVCCNPYHIIRGTVADNNNDMAVRARHGMSAYVRRAIRRLSEQGVVVQEIADRYGIAPQTVRDIVKGRTRPPDDEVSSA
jgi:hypothetical protein